MRTSPDYIQLYPTLRCNRSCDFCFNKSMPFIKDMAFPDFRLLLDKLKNIGVKTIDIMGGEPTLHQDIISMIQEAEHGGFNVNLSSNGSNIETLDRIQDAARKTLIGLSINDLETLNSLREFIAHRRPVIKTVYRPDLDVEMIAEISALRPKKFYLLYRDVMAPEDMPSAVSFDRFFKAVMGEFGTSAGAVFCSGFIPDTENYPELSLVRCPAGTTKLGVLPDGSVYPCNLFFGQEELRLGNILEDPFDKIWRHPALTFFRSFTRNACCRTSCELHARCHGGCPAHSLLHHGEVSGPEPRCL